MRLSRLIPVLWHRSLQPIQAVLGLPRSAPYSFLSIHSDLSGWVLEEEAIEFRRIAERLGIRARCNYGLGVNAGQCIHYTSQFVLRDPRYFNTRNRISVDYFHGLPSTAPIFAEVFDAFRRHHQSLTRVRVSHSRMEQAVLEAGVDPSKVHRIPIGINLSYFSVPTSDQRAAARDQLRLPDSAVVVGSFQKDGVGWGEGMEPKLIKGPDLLLKVIERLKSKVPDLHVVLSGPSRGYVKAGLEKLGVPYRHLQLKQYADVGLLYRALDLYLITSRDEGGPKAILESMASGVPLVTSQVGQAIDLVRHGENAWMVEVDDVEGLTHWAEYVISHRGSPQVARVLELARQTAEANSYEQQIPLWRKFMTGFLAGPLKDS